MKISSLARLGLKVVALWDNYPELNLTFNEVREAAHNASLVKLLAERARGLTDFSFLLSHPDELQEVESALCDACYAIELGQSERLLPNSKGMQLASALIFEAVRQQRFPPLSR